MKSWRTFEDLVDKAQVLSLLTESTTDQAFVLHFVTLVLVCKLLAVGELVVTEVALGGGETLAHAAAARAGLGLALAVCLGELRAVGALVQTRRLGSAVKRSIGFTITENAPRRRRRAFSWLKAPTSPSKGLLP